MTLGSFYFISNIYYDKFKNCGLMENKEYMDGGTGGRPCYFSFKEENTDLYWMVPISSQIDKYEAQRQIAIGKFGICDGIVFGHVLGEKRAFLIQNMCPITDRYIDNIYIDKSSENPVTIPNDLKSEINAKVRKAVRLYRRGTKIVLTKILDIEKVLLDELTIHI